MMKTTTKCERLAAIDHKWFRLILAVLLLQCASFGAPDFAGSGVSTSIGMQLPDRNRKVSETVQLSALIASQQYCFQPVDNRRLDETLRLKLRLRVTNVSDETLVIHRYGHAVFNVRLSETLAKARAKNYAYETHATLMRSLEQRQFDDAAPTNEFRVLRPNESFEYEYPEQIDITVQDGLQPEQNLNSGNYFLQVKTQTWAWETKKAAELQRRWARYGYFWFYDITSLPLPLRIEKPPSITSVCQQ